MTTAAALSVPDSLFDFHGMFRDDHDCAVFLERIRWPDGFACPQCGTVGEPQRLATRPGILRCRSCLAETSLTSGTIMHRTKMPLLMWFYGAYLVTSETPGMSALQFQRQMGMKRYETAYMMLQKLRAAMIRPDRDRIGGAWPVEMDETLIGGRTRGEGRGVHHKAVVVGAVEVRQGSEDDPGTASRREKHRRGVPLRGMTYAGRLRLRIVPGRGAKHLEQFAAESILPGTHVQTDGWVGYDGLAGLGFDHDPLVVDGDPERLDEHLPMFHIVASNLKTWLRGTHHGVSQTHLQAYLNEYVFRFNRRFYPMGAFAKVLGIAVRSRGPTYDDLYGGQWVHRKNPGRR
jgi:hypothetical protein